METICVPSFKPISIHHLSRKLHNNRRNSTICFCAANHDEAEEHKRKQELLVKIAMLQTQKVRLTDFLDERSAYLTQFAQDADAEFDQIGEGALNELDQASERVCVCVYTLCFIFIPKKTAGSAARKSVYMLFMALLGAAITTNSVITFPQIEWKKTLALVLLFLALFAQYIYETRLSTEAENTDKNK